MALKLLLIISLAIALASPQDQPPKKRLIKYKLGEPAKWMTPAEMQQLLSGKSFGYLGLTLEGVDNTEEKTGEARSLSEKKDADYPDQKYPDRPPQKEVVEKLFSSLSKDRMEVSVRKLSSYYSRHPFKFFGPDEAEGWLDQEIKSILAGYKGDSSIRHISDRSDPSLNDPYQQNNILVKLSRRDPELVILGAHYDTAVGDYIESPWKNESRRAPGADDNATGCAVLLEVLRALVQSGATLNQTVEFHFYAASEYGRLGSDDVAKKYKEEKAKVKGMLNLDRCGNGKSIGFVIGGISQWGHETYRPLTNFVNMLVKEYVQQDILSKEVVCDSTCFSDHFPWTREGFPSAYVVEYDANPHINNESDTVETVNFELVNDFAKVALAFVVELGEVSVSSGGDGRPEAGWTLVGINLMVWIWIRL